jgi:hypothetical protein
VRPQRIRRVVLVLGVLVLQPVLGAADSDGDGLSDVVESAPLSLSSPRLADTDADGLSDDVELRAGTNPLDEDTDGDGLSDGVERIDGGSGTTNPRRADSDGDGLADGSEDSNRNGRVDDGETNPRAADSDGDALPDGLEDSNRNGVVDDGETNPRVADSDGDGVVDGVEDADQNGQQGPRESSPVVADVHPTHRNDVLGVPEPLLVDWVRALGARAGEFEVNVLGLLQSDGAFEVAPEVEWVPLNGFGLELEAVVKSSGFDALKLGAQWTLLSDARSGLGHGFQGIVRWQRGSNLISVTGLHLAHARLGTRASLGTMAGIEAAADGRVSLAFHPTVGVRLHDRITLVFEANGRAGPWGLEAAFVPHLRADLPHVGSVQFGAGPTVSLTNGQVVATGLLALRVTWER